MKNVLVVEDEEHLATGLRFNLEAEGFRATVVDTGEAALETIRSGEKFDLVLMDVMLPGKSGFEVVSELRRDGHYVPVIMLTARGRPDDVVQGFSAGADDYLPKPFELPVLLARIRGLLRRREWMAENGAEPIQHSYEFGGRTIDFNRQQLVVDDEVRELTVMEVDLFRFLIDNEGKTVSRKDLLSEVWGVREDTDTRSIDNFIVRLRRYIEPEPSKPRHLITVRGVGYRFVANPEVTTP
jgi:DNA-binding response OmpR family regulator